MSEREQTDAVSPALAVPKAGKDWRELQFNFFFKTFGFWKDWRSIRADPLVIINDPSNLQTKPFSYALTAMLLPGLILATALGEIGMFVNIPKTQIDRALEQQQDLKNNMQRLIDDHSKHDINDPLYDPSLEELFTEQLDKIDSDLSRQIDRLASSPDKSQETRGTSKNIRLRRDDRRLRSP